MDNSEMMKLARTVAGHVSSYPTGDWRTLLTKQEKSLANSALGDWLQENGYPLD